MTIALLVLLVATAAAAAGVVARAYDRYHVTDY